MARGRKKKEEPVKILTEPEETTEEITEVEPETPQNEEKTPTRQNNDVNILTLGEFLRNVAQDTGANPYSRFKYISEFQRLNPGFKFPVSGELAKLTYVRNIAHFHNYKESLT